MSKGARQKGSAFEREVASLFSDKFDETFRRTPLSGGWAKEKIQGDIVGDDPRFNLVVECKNHKTLSVPEWWRQVESDTPKGKYSILVMKFSARYLSSKTCPIKKNLHGIYALMRVADVKRILEPFSDLYTYMYASTSYEGKRISYTSIWYDMLQEDKKVAGIQTSSYTGKEEVFVLVDLPTLLLHIDKNLCYNLPRKKKLLKRRKVSDRNRRTTSKACS